VVFWLVGFDIIYATQDWEFDRSQGLHSLPARLGIAPSLQVARAAHAITAVLLLAFGLISSLRVPYYIGFAIILACLVVQHRLAKKRDPISLNVAFFRMNAVISAVFLGGVVVDVVLQ
jgi:4-hydroxybenzoate polyprenyltransferase